MFDEGEVRNRRSAPPRLRARCPECNSWVPLKDSVEQWDIVECPNCDTLLEVVQLKPPRLDYADDVWDEDEEDWEDEDWEDENDY